MYPIIAVSKLNIVATKPIGPILDVRDFPINAKTPKRIGRFNKEDKLPKANKIIKMNEGISEIMIITLIHPAITTNQPKTDNNVIKNAEINDPQINPTREIGNKRSKPAQSPGMLKKVIAEVSSKLKIRSKAKFRSKHPNKVRIPLVCIISLRNIRVVATDITPEMAAIAEHSRIYTTVYIIFQRSVLKVFKNLFLSFNSSLISFDISF